MDLEKENKLYDTIKTPSPSFGAIVP